MNMINLFCINQQLPVNSFESWNFSLSDATEMCRQTEHSHQALDIFLFLFFTRVWVILCCSVLININWNHMITINELTTNLYNYCNSNTDTFYLRCDSGKKTNAHAFHKFDYFWRSQYIFSCLHLRSRNLNFASSFRFLNALFWTFLMSYQWCVRPNFVIDQMQMQHPSAFYGDFWAKNEDFHKNLSKTAIIIG